MNTRKFFPKTFFGRSLVIILIPVLLKLGTLKEPKIPIEKYIRYVKSNDKEVLPYVLELIDSTFSAY